MFANHSIVLQMLLRRGRIPLSEPIDPQARPNRVEIGHRYNIGTLWDSTRLRHCYSDARVHPNFELGGTLPGAAPQEKVLQVKE
jgi:hypothetical protein